MNAKQLDAVERPGAAPSRRTGTVVVGVDGSPTGRAALHWAIRESLVLELPLTVCHVRAVAGRTSARPARSDSGDDTLRHAVATAVHRLGEGRVAATHHHGDPARALTLLSDGACLLVIGTHGAFAHGAHLYTPLSTRIIARATCPVVTVPLIAGQLGPFDKHVVVGIDGSTSARAALEFGYAHAARHGLPLAAVHITDEPRAEHLLTTEVGPWEAQYPQVHTARAVHAGRPVPGLLRAATGAHLLVVGSRGRGLPGATDLGSVVERLVGSGTCPIAVAPRS